MIEVKIYVWLITVKINLLKISLQCIRDLLNKTGKQQTEGHAPVWVPDIEASLCMVCKKTKFSVIERRVSMI